MNDFTQWLINNLSTIFSEEIIIFIISMIPFIELKGGLLAASIMGIPMIKAVIICYIGTVIPMPLAVWGFKRFLIWIQAKPIAKKIMPKINKWCESKRSTIDKFAYWGIILNVVNPIPGTGGYSNALLAALLNMKSKRALSAIILGLLISAFLMAGIYYGTIELFF